MVQLIGHRGARGLFPENTMEGFRKTLLLNVKGLELDVVISADKQILISHEPWMNHLFCSAPDGKPIEKAEEKAFNLFKMNYAEIALFDCGNRPNINYPDQQLSPASKPLLEEVFELMAGISNNPFSLFLEVKSSEEWYGVYQPEPSEYAMLIYRFFQKHPCTFPLIIQSFDPFFLNAFYRLNPSATLGLLVENKRSVSQNLNLLTFKPTYYNPHFLLVNNELVEILKKKKIKMVPWTVNTLKEATRLEQLGVDTIITDFPNLFL